MKYTNEELLKRINEIENGEYTSITKDFQNGIKTRVTLKHKCGYTYNCILKGFLNENKSRCPKCNKVKPHSNKKVSEEEFINRLKKEAKDYQYISGFINMNTKCILLHTKCNNYFEVTPHMFLGNKKSRCPFCANETRGKYAIKNNYLENILIKSKLDKEYMWLEDYKNNNKIKHKIKHIKCNNIYEVRPNDFQQGCRCPYCKESKGEKRISEILDKLNISYETQYSFSDCKYKLPLRFDFKLEDSSHNIILIEYDGEFHYENPFYNESLEKTKIRDNIKNEYCKNNNLKLYRISYKDFDNLEEIIKEIVIAINKPF